MRKCEGTKLSKYKWRSQNTSRAVALPLYLLYKYIWETETKLSHAGAPLTCSHSTLAKQNGVRDKQQIGNFSWLEWQWDPIPVGVTCWPVFPIVKVEELWEWRALPGLREVTGWVTLTDGSDLPLHCLLSTLFFLWQSWTRRVYTDWLWLEEVPSTKPSQKVLNDGTFSVRFNHLRKWRLSPRLASMRLQAGKAALEILKDPLLYVFYPELKRMSLEWMLIAQQTSKTNKQKQLAPCVKTKTSKQTHPSVLSLV